MLTQTDKPVTPVSASLCILPAVGLQVNSTALRFLCGFWGSKFRPPCLCFGHFTSWLSLQPLLLAFPQNLSVCGVGSAKGAWGRFIHGLNKVCILMFAACSHGCPLCAPPLQLPCRGPFELRVKLEGCVLHMLETKLSASSKQQRETACLQSMDSPFVCASLPEAQSRGACFPHGIPDRRC